jgi:small subunit ribosomal protein S8
MDQIANMINMIKNASVNGHEFVVVSFSKIKLAIAECLVKEGYLKSVNKKNRKGFPVLELELSYQEEGIPRITGVGRISKSSRRVYYGVKDIKKTISNYGMVVLSTPKGILTNKQASKEMVGGEALFKIW